jgi:hypothetical protein|tara:strand:- start:500 stop:835 length:336 start_codon:yes stop_codon:yes gene_type:complete
MNMRYDEGLSDEEIENYESKHDIEPTMTKFKDLKFKQIEGRGVQAWIPFRNGFEVSVVKHQFSYGGDKDLYEIGVFNAAGNMCDPLDWGDDVKGWLTPQDVEQELESIQAL